MRRSLSLFLIFLLILSLAMSASANDLKIVDRADVLTEDQEASLTAKAQQLVDNFGMDVVIVIVHDTEGTDVVSYADDYYDENGYGMGYDYSGVLFLLAIDTREWAISTCGNAIYALTDYGIEQLFSTIDDDLAVDNYYRAFDAYLEELPTYFKAYENGDPIDGEYRDDSYDGPGYIDPADRNDVIYHPDHIPEDTPGLGTYIGIVLVSLFIGAVTGGIVLLILRGQMNTVKPQSTATNYLVNGSYHLKRHQDIFLYSRVSRVRRSENHHSSGGGPRGGSSIHRSSSGRSHGGRSGRF